jgi:hypothetical protein
VKKLTSSRTEKKRSKVKEELLEKRNKEAVVHLHPSAQHTWPQLSACLSFLHLQRPQLGQGEPGARKFTLIDLKGEVGSCISTKHYQSLRFYPV